MASLSKGLLPSLVSLIEGTYNEKVVSRVGDFAGVYDAGDHFLVSSTDGVGSKIVVACEEANRTGEMSVHECIGVDLVNHSINDILVHGASPLFFLDYFGHAVNGSADIQLHVMRGIVKAANECGLPVISGETSQMTGFYTVQSYDVIGTIVGSVPKGQHITGKRIVAGDRMIALPSSGLHTNGFTTLRRIFTGDHASLQNADLWNSCESLGKSVLQESLTPHKSYLKQVTKLRTQCDIKGLVHVTGGGIEANLKRVVKRPYEVTWAGWEWPSVFSIIKNAGSLTDEDMRKEYNLGVGMIVVVDASAVGHVLQSLYAEGESAFVMGVVQ